MSDLVTRLVITGDASGAANAVGRTRAGLQSISTQLAQVRTGLVGAFAGAGVVDFARRLASAADAMSQVRARLALATQNMAQAAAAQRRLFDIAQATRQSYTGLADTYASVARATSGLGISQARLLAVTQTLSQAMAIGGGSAASMQAALFQLQQGLASGALRGEELNSVMEQTPRLAQAIADGLGVEVGQLRRLAEAGELTAEKVIGALERSAPRVAEEFARIPPTIGGAFQTLGNAAVQTVGELDQATGASTTLAEAIQALARGLREGAPYLRMLANAAVPLAKLGAAAASVWAMVAAGRALLAVSALLAANPVGLVLLGIGAVVGGVAAYAGSEDGVKLRLANINRELKQIQANLDAIAQRDQKGLLTRSDVDYRDNFAPRKIKELEAKRTRLEGEVAKAEGDGPADTDPGGRHAREPKAGPARRRTDPAATRAAATQARRDADFLADLQRQRFAEEVGLTDETVGALERLAAMRDRGALSALDYAQAIDTVLNSDRLLAEEQERQSAAVGRMADETRAETDALAAQVRAERERNAEIGLTTEALAELNATRDEAAAAAKEEEAANLEAAASVAGPLKDAYEAQAARLREQARLLRDLAAARREGGQKTAADAAQREGVEAARRTASEVERLVGDALMRGFSRGKEGGQSLKEQLQALFKTLVLRPIVDLAAKPIAVAAQELTAKLLPGLAPATAGGGSVKPGAEGDPSAPLRKVFDAWTTHLSGMLKGVTGSLSEVWGQLTTGLGSLFEGGLSGLGELFGGLLSGMGDLVSGFGSAFGDALGGIVGALGSGGGGGLGGLFGAVIGAFGFHRGGRVSGRPTFVRPVPLALFEHAPRYHSGRGLLRPGEVAAILQDTEEVITDDDPRHSNNLRAGLGAGVEVRIIEQPGKGGETRQRSEGGRSIVEVMVEQVRGALLSDVAGRGAFARGLEGTYGLNRAAGAAR